MLGCPSAHAGQTLAFARECNGATGCVLQGPAVLECERTPQRCVFPAPYQVSDFGLAKHVPGGPNGMHISSSFGVITHTAPETLKSYIQTQVRANGVTVMYAADSRCFLACCRTEATIAKVASQRAAPVATGATRGLAFRCPGPCCSGSAPSFHRAVQRVATGQRPAQQYPCQQHSNHQPSTTPNGPVSPTK